MNGKNMFDKTKLRSLSFLIRYSNVPRIRDESVSEHSFFVAVEVISLFQKYDFNLEHAISMAIMHDFLESEIDDVSFFTKFQFPKIKQAVKEAEEECLRDYPNYIADYIKEYMERKTIESKIVHLADAIQCYSYAETEVKMGNHGYMNEIIKNTPLRIGDLESELKEALR